MHSPNKKPEKSSSKQKKKPVVPSAKELIGLMPKTNIAAKKQPNPHQRHTLGSSQVMSGYKKYTEDLRQTLPKTLTAIQLLSEMNKQQPKKSKK